MQKFNLSKEDLYQSLRYQMRCRCSTKVVRKDTFKLPGNKALRAVLRGITQILSIAKIVHILTEVRFDVIAITRMNNKVDGTRIAAGARATSQRS